MLPTFLGSERYREIRKLGEGGMGIVWEVEDRERGERVALKTLRNLDPDKLYRLKREFRVLSELEDPNLVSLHELMVADDSCFFTMELIEGTDILTYVRGSSRWDDSQSSGSSSASESSGGSTTHSHVTPMDPTGDEASPSPTPSAPVLGHHSWPTCNEERLRRVLPQLAWGLTRLHEAGNVHRDIKPSNIMVSTNGRLVLLDFGLVAPLDESQQSQDGHVVGTGAYMSPEQCCGVRPTPADDWYAVGAVLYEALTGRQPFRGALTRIMLEKQRHEPAPPRAIVTGVPRDLDELCVDLLAREAKHRPSGEQVLRRLGADRERPLPRRGDPLSDRGRKLRFTGREQELERLSRGLETLHDHSAQATLITGPSGIGKSALLRCFIDQQTAQHSDLVVLQGRCYDLETVPFQAIDNLIDNLSRFWRQLSDKDAAALVPREAALLARLFPVLERVAAVAEAPRGRPIADPQEMRTRAFAALRETLQRLGERRLLVLALDDMQWADANTLLLLTDLMRPPDPPRLYLVLSGRPESRERLEQLVGSMDARSELLALERLDEAAAVDLARSLLGRCETDLAARVAAEAAGSPFFISELAQHVQSAGHDSLEDVRLEQVLSQRIRSLPEATRQVLEIVVLAGAHLSQRTLRSATGLAKADLARELRTLRSLKLVRAAGRRRHDRFEPFHDRIRDATLAGLSDDSRRTHHRALALALGGKAGAEQLAYHWRGAGDHGRAAEHALTAAEEALERLDFDRASNLFRMALTLGSHDAPARREIMIALAEALANAGRPAEAAEAFTAAHADAEPALQLELKRRSAEELLRGGYLEEGLHEIHEVLATIGLRLAATPWRALLSLLAHRAWLRLRGLRWRELSASDIPPRVLTKVDVCWSVAAGLAIVDTIRGAHFQSRQLLMALRAGERIRVGRALAIETSYLAAQGSERARRVLVQARDLSQNVDDPHVRGLAWIAEAFIAYYLDNRWRSSLHCFRKAEELFRVHQAGGWELDTALLWACFNQIYLGELAELARLVPTYAQAAERRGDRYMTVNVRSRANLVWLVRDDVETAQRELELAVHSWTPMQRGFQLQHFFALGAGCEIALYGGEPAKAAELMQRALQPMQRSLLLHVTMARAEVISLRARIALAHAAESNGSSRRAALREAGRHVAAMRRIRLPLAGALIPMFEAGIANLEGNDDTTAARLRLAASRFDDLETRLYANAVRHRLGELLGGDEGAELCSDSHRFMAAQEVKKPQRIAAMLVPGWPYDA